MAHPAHQLAGIGVDFYRLIQQHFFPTSAYRRLRSHRSRKRRVRIVNLDKQRSWKLIKRFPKLRFRLLSPFTLLAKLRDAYVNLLLAASSNMASSSEAMAIGNVGIIPDRMRTLFNESPPKEYEDLKVLMELYRAQKLPVVSSSAHAHDQIS